MCPKVILYEKLVKIRQIVTFCVQSLGYGVNIVMLEKSDKEFKKFRYMAVALENDIIWPIKCA